MNLSFGVVRRPAKELGEQSTATAIDVYHKKHRYRAKGALWSGTTPIFQRRPSENRP